MALTPYCHDCNAGHWPVWPECPKKAPPDKVVSPTPVKVTQVKVTTPIPDTSVTLTMPDVKVTRPSVKVTEVTLTETRQQRWRRLHPDKRRVSDREYMREYMRRRRAK